MVLVIGRIKIQESLGATASTFAENIDFNYNAHQINLSTYALKLTTTAATTQNLVDKIDRVRLVTKRGDPESSIDGDDLFSFPQEANIGRHNYVTGPSTTDNDPMAFGLAYPLTPHPNNPQSPFGLSANQGVQFQYDTAADVAADHDNYTTDLTVEGLTEKGATQHIKFQRDAFTSGAVDSTQDTQILGSRLLGVYNFMTTSFTDLAAAASHNVTGIREQQISVGENVLYRYKPAQAWQEQRNPTITDVTASTTMKLDDGRWFKDFGINQPNPGLNIAGLSNAEIKTVAGVASEATRVYGVLLVN